MDFRSFSRHFFFWAAWLLYYMVMFGSQNGRFWETGVEHLLELPVLIPFIYLNMYVLAPRLLLRRRFLLYGVIFTALLLFVSFFNTVIWYYVPPLIDDSIPPRNYSILKSLNIFKLLRCGTDTFALAMLTTAWHFYRNWQSAEARQKSLENEKLQAELNYLRAQINPHFLFNTLNNLYALTLQQSVKSPAVVMKLSQIMEHMLYDCRREWIAVDKTVDFLHNYLELERIRLDDPDALTFTVHGHANGRPIPALILLPFIENAFKHGLWENASENAFVHIDLNIGERELTLKVENACNAETPAREESASGFGLENVQKRLRLLYGDRYSLEQFRDDTTFLTVLQIPFL